VTTFRWLILALVILDGAAIALILRQDGAKENLVWWVFLIIPLLIVGMIIADIVYSVGSRLAR